MSGDAPTSLARCAALVQPALRSSLDRLDDARMRQIAGYQLGFVEADGTASSGHGGKGLRGALTILATEAAGCDVANGVPAAVAVELVHNFSLLHDDIMDRDVERRHRPTGWVVFGEGPTILAGTAMLTLAAQVLASAAPGALPCLLVATQRLISGQSDDLRLESDSEADVDDVLRMEAGKTAALLSCAASIGPTAAGAPAEIVDALAGYGHELGIAFQLVDDVLGITGDPVATGKSASSDLRAGKRSAPIVAARCADNEAGRRLHDLLDAGPPTSEEDVALAAKLVDEAGGIEWTHREAQAHARQAFAHLERDDLEPSAADELRDLGRYILDRDR
ncbi:MAG: polyprenyl synthetase family protein [Jatrophihabitans sp.]